MNPIVLGGAAFMVALGAVALQTNTHTPSLVATTDACETLAAIEPESLVYPKDRVGDNLPPVAEKVRLDWAEPSCNTHSYTISAVSPEGETLGLAHIAPPRTLAEITPPVPVNRNTEWTIHSD